MPHTDSLIRTKLHQPMPRPGLVARPRLQEQLALGLRGLLTLVAAPAGFGKTTLLATCLAGYGMPVAWLSLDKNDNQPGRFLGYLVAALQEADPLIGVEAAHLLAGSPQPHHEALLASLVNDLERAGQEFALALDDYQFISSQAVHEHVAFLLDHAPPNFHLVIASRSDPPLQLARLRARDQLVELRAADLRFSRPEVEQFLNDSMGLDLETGSVAALAERTEGWIAGLQMAGLSIRAREDVHGFIAGFSGTNRYIMDYLLEEVLANQTPEIQQFLLHTSILERLTAPLCDALLLAGEAPASSRLRSAAALEHLERTNLFLLPLDDARSWYRYHHLFADLLRARLQEADPGLAPRLHLQAADWLEQQRYVGEAIHHLLAAGAVEQAAELIEREGPARLAAGDPALLQMADNLPQAMILTRPKIGLYQAWLLIIQGRIAQALPLLHDLAGVLAGRDPASGQGWLGTVVALALAFLAPAREAAELAPLLAYELLEMIPEDELVLRNAADILYGMTLGRRGELERAVEVSLRCIAREQDSQGAPVMPTLAPFLSRIYLMQGRLQAAAALCRAYLDPLSGRESRFIYTTGSMMIDLGEVLYEWNCLDEARQYIQDGLQANQLWCNIMTDGFGLAALARVQQALGDYAVAQQTVERFEARLLVHAQPREFDEDLRTLQARQQLAGGDLAGAARWADQIQFNPDFELHREHYRLTLARVRLAQGRYAEVESLLSGTTPPPGAGSRIARQLETDLLLAAAAAGQGRLPEAQGLLEACLAQGETEGYIRVFLDAGEVTRELLAAYLRSGHSAHRQYAQKILEAFALADPAGRDRLQPAGLPDPLSGRELEVLHLIAAGSTNQEIARQLVVAPGTVKAHTSSIYRKLDVANRTEAVARARQLGLLP